MPHSYAPMVIYLPALSKSFLVFFWLIALPFYLLQNLGTGQLFPSEPFIMSTHSSAQASALHQDFSIKDFKFDTRIRQEFISGSAIDLMLFESTVQIVPEQRRSHPEQSKLKPSQENFTNRFIRGLVIGFFNGGIA
jgi:hypothetical protein